MAELNDHEQRELYDATKANALMLAELQQHLIPTDGKGKFLPRVIASLTRLEAKS